MTCICTLNGAIIVLMLDNSAKKRRMGMKKFERILIVFTFAIFCHIFLAQSAMASDVWVSTSYQGGDKYEFYVQTHHIKENSNPPEFSVPLKLVINGKLAKFYDLW